MIADWKRIGAALNPVTTLRAPVDLESILDAETLAALKPADMVTFDYLALKNGRLIARCVQVIPAAAVTDRPDKRGTSK